MIYNDYYVYFHEDKIYPVWAGNTKSPNRVGWEDTFGEVSRLASVPRDAVCIELFGCTSPRDAAEDALKTAIQTGDIHRVKPGAIYEAHDGVVLYEGAGRITTAESRYHRPSTNAYTAQTAEPKYWLFPDHPGSPQENRAQSFLVSRLG